MQPRFNALFGHKHPLIGMIHLKALPGSPTYAGDLSGVREFALRDASALAQGGASALMLENFGDVPFFPGQVPPCTIAAMSAIAAAIRAQHKLPLGINVLRNDGVGALAIAKAVGAQFIRVNVLGGARLTDQGIIEGIAHQLLRERSKLHAVDIQIWADVAVKHSKPLAALSLAEECKDLVKRALADALIVSGAGTGAETALSDLKAVREAVPGVPVLVGSGIQEHTVKNYLAVADGFIVGSSLKVNGQLDLAVDPERVATLAKTLRRP